MSEHNAVASLEADASGGDTEIQVPFPVLRTFAQAATVRVLSGLAELSYVAGREGDEFTDWNSEADEALIDAFKFERVSRISWLDTAKAALCRAFEAGVAQREINLGANAVPDWTTRVARAHALIYRDEIDFPQEACPAAVDVAVAHVAYRLADRHPVSPAEAAHAAILAFRWEQLKPSLEVARRALERARAGHAERVAREAHARNREAAIAAAMSRIFGE